MRGLPGMLTRRRVTTGVIVVAAGSVATVAVAAGPVIYSEYTTGGDQQSRIVQEDGRDSALPLDVTGAAVSPDGRRIAQTTLQTSPKDDDVFTTSLRVTAGDGTGATSLLESRSSENGDLSQAITATPVWSPDSTRVIVARTTVENGGVGRTTRVICVVDAKTCSDAGEVPKGAGAGEDGLRGDVVTWQATDGPIVADAVRRPAEPTRVRCGAGVRTVQAPTVRLRGIGASVFGAPLALRGLPGDDQDDDGLADTTIDAVAVAGGTLAVDAPQATVRTGRLSCRGSFATAKVTRRLGTLRLRLRAAGRTTTLPAPPGLRSGDGLRLVGTDDGGAVLVSALAPSLRSETFCDSRRQARAAKRVYDCSTSSDFGGFGSFSTDRPSSVALRVWRYVPTGTPHFERITTARRSALETLKAATDLTVASGDAVLAVTDGAIERVPLDGGAPTTIARGRGVSLDVSAW